MGPAGLRRRGAAADAGRGQSWIHMMTNSLGGAGRKSHRITAPRWQADPMHVVDLDQAVRTVRAHCARLTPGTVPRVVTSGNFASPVALLDLVGRQPAAVRRAIAQDPRPDTSRRDPD